MRSTKIARIPHDGMRDGTHIDVEVSYRQRRQTVYHQRVLPSGFYLNAKPVTPNGVCVATVPQADKSRLLFESGRFSEKKMEKAIQMGQEEMSELVEELLASQLAA